MNRLAFILALLVIPASLLAQDKKPVDPFETAFGSLEETLRESAKKKPTHVAWLIDQSSTMAAVRKRLGERVGKLDIKPAQKNGLTALVAGFAAELDIKTPRPLTSIPAMGRAIAKVESDSTGKENVFQAVSKFAEWLSKRGEKSDERFLVIVTDERGDDFRLSEQVTSRCKRAGVRVFCLGHAAPFGSEEGLVEFRYPDGFAEEIPVEQGPETASPHLPRLPTLGGVSIDFRRISSGFGPWALSRLCDATDGEYLIAMDSTRTRFNASRMATYRPEYPSMRMVEVGVKRSRTRTALVQSAMLSRQQSWPSLKLTFQADRSPILRGRLTATQKPCAILEYRASEIVKYLEAAGTDRDKLTSPRWRASYDLAMGRALAVQVRVRLLNYDLARMKVDAPKIEDPKLNTWEVFGVKDPQTAPPNDRKMIERSKAYLNRVTKEHPGTPFAHVAKLELDRGFGWSRRAIHMKHPPEPPPKKRPLIIPGKL